jgi:putative transposase
MKQDNVVALKTPDEKDPLQELLREGARKLLREAIGAEVDECLAKHRSLITDDSSPAVVRNGYLPERTIQTGLGDVGVRVPKIRDRLHSGIKFNSQLVPPYLKRTKSLDEFLPWLYLRGISSGDFSEALQHLLGPQARGLSSTTIARLKQGWEQDYQAWQKRDLSTKRFVYIWADGVYCNVRMDDRQCLLVIVGSDESGRKELLALSDGYRESASSWEEVLLDLRQHGLNISPNLAVGDGALGFWKALSKLWPSTVQQRCWVHKTANVLGKLPKAIQPKVKEALHNIWRAETKPAAYRAFDHCIEPRCV